MHFYFQIWEGILSMDELVKLIKEIIEIFRIFSFQEVFQNLRFWREKISSNLM